MTGGGIENERYDIRTFIAGKGGIDMEQYKDQLVKLIFDGFPEYYHTEDDAKADVEWELRESLGAIAIALDRDKVVGYGTLHPLHEGYDEILFGDAYVLPSYRRRGMYTQLVDVRLRIAREWGAKSVEIMTDGTNVAIPSLIERRGFKFTGILPGNYRKEL